MKYLSLQVPGYNVETPAGIPTGGLPKLVAVAKNGVFLLLAFGTAASVVLIIWAGIQWITSSGDKQKLAAARARIIYALIGLALIFASFGIMGVLSNVFNVPLL